MAVRFLDDRGQATVGLVVALPVVLAVVLIACNAMAFVSECARFDRIARSAMRICATSPAYGVDAGACAADVENIVSGQMASGNISCTVSASQQGSCVVYLATMTYEPTILGACLRSEVFGVSITPLSHEVSLAVDPYDPGVFA